MIVGDRYYELCRATWDNQMEWEDGHYGWLTQTFCHRRNGPYIYCHNNTILYAEYRLWHNDSGPAIMSDKPRKDRWFIYGIEFTEEYEEC